jgi:hypothetical protein
MYIPVTGNGEPFYFQGFPVRFYKTDGTEWVANFHPGWTGLNRVIEFENTQNLLVIAFGTCYLMNPNDPKPISVFGAGFSRLYQASRNRLVLQDEISLTVIEPDGSHWNTERISWDGIEDMKVENNIVTGLSYRPMNDPAEWVPFTYDLDTKTLTRGSYHGYDGNNPW